MCSSQGVCFAPWVAQSVTCALVQRQASNLSRYIVYLDNIYIATSEHPPTFDPGPFVVGTIEHFTRGNILGLNVDCTQKLIDIQKLRRKISQWTRWTSLRQVLQFFGQVLYAARVLHQSVAPYRDAMMTLVSVSSHLFRRPEVLDERFHLNDRQRKHSCIYKIAQTYGPRFYREKILRKRRIHFLRRIKVLRCLRTYPGASPPGSRRGRGPAVD